MTTGENAGDTAAEPPPIRIGTAERAAATKALDEHLAAGRLGIEEYADRSAIAANATVAPELTALFTDLPEPHPVLPGQGATVAPAAAAPPAMPPPGEVDRFAGWGPRVVAVAPILALVLFLATVHVFGQAWLFFLLIPASRALVYGHWGDNERHRHRDERRALRRADRDRY